MASSKMHSARTRIQTKINHHQLPRPISVTRTYIRTMYSTRRDMTDIPIHKSAFPRHMTQLVHQMHCNQNQTNQATPTAQWRDARARSVTLSTFKGHVRAARPSASRQCRFDRHCRRMFNHAPRTRTRVDQMRVRTHKRTSAQAHKHTSAQAHKRTSAQAPTHTRADDRTCAR